MNVQSTDSQLILPCISSLSDITNIFDIDMIILGQSKIPNAITLQTKSIENRGNMQNNGIIKTS